MGARPPHRVGGRASDGPTTPAGPAGRGDPGVAAGASESTWRSFVIGPGNVALVYALGLLRVVVLPVIVALMLTTLLLPIARALRRHSAPDALRQGVQ